MPMMSPPPSFGRKQVARSRMSVKYPSITPEKSVKYQKLLKMFQGVGYYQVIEIQSGQVVLVKIK